MQLYISKELREIIPRKEFRKRVNRLEKTWVRNGDSKFKRATILPISWPPELANIYGGVKRVVLTAVRREDGTVNPIILDQIVRDSPKVYLRHFWICSKRKIKPGDPELSLPPRFRKVLAM